MGNKNDSRKRKAATRILRDAIADNNLYYSRPDGSLSNIRETKYRSVTYPTSEDYGSFIYEFLHEMGLHKPEVNVTNPGALKYDSDHIFPRNMFIPKASQEIMNAEKSDIYNVINAVFTKYNTPAIMFVAGIDQTDVKRVTMAVMKTSLNKKMIDFSFAGGVSDAEIEKIIH